MSNTSGSLPPGGNSAEPRFSPVCARIIRFMRPIIRAENISKLYRIGARREWPPTLRDSITRAFRNPLGRFRRNGNSETTIWALKDVNFEAPPGEVVGIMGRNEIDRKFDEIVGFAEVEEFIDTPVKHYSSGMYMRLAFAVAAHLDPEILLV